MLHIFLKQQDCWCLPLSFLSCEHKNTLCCCSLGFCSAPPPAARRDNCRQANQSSPPEQKNSCLQKVKAQNCAKSPPPQVAEGVRSNVLFNLKYQKLFNSNWKMRSCRCRKPKKKMNRIKRENLGPPQQRWVEKQDGGALCRFSKT